MYSVLRLMTLLSTTNSGLKQAEFDQLRRAFIMCYGYKEISTILNLQDSRLLKLRDKRFDWSKIRSVSSIILPTTFPCIYFLIQFVYRNSNWSKKKPKVRSRFRTSIMSSDRWLPSLSACLSVCLKAVASRRFRGRFNCCPVSPSSPRKGKKTSYSSIRLSIASRKCLSTSWVE